LDGPLVSNILREEDGSESATGFWDTGGAQRAVALETPGVQLRSYIGEPEIGSDPCSTFF
jgi:hypothetical protein